MVERRRIEEEPFPRRIEPMLTIPGKRIPKDSQNRICELYFPGMRIIAYINKDGVRLMTRQNDNVVGKFEEILEDLWTISNKKPMVLDGNIVCTNNHLAKNAAEERAKQSKLQQRVNPIGPCYFLVSDVLYANGKNLLSTPLLERKRVMEKIIPEKTGLIIPTPFSENDHKIIRRVARNLHIKEVGYRKKDGTYKQGVRSRDWLRVPVR